MVKKDASNRSDGTEHTVEDGTFEKDIKSIPLSDIAVPADRMPSLQWEEVDRMAESLREKGQPNPIVVRPSAIGDDTPYLLVSERYFFEAARALGWDSILASVVEGPSTDRLELAEADENRVQAELRNQNEIWKKPAHVDGANKTDRSLAIRDMTDRGPLAEWAREATPASGGTTDVAPPEVTPADDAFLKRAADEIRTQCKRACSDLIEVGRLLAEVKKRLHHGEWLPWLEREFNWSASMASKLIKVHETFGANSERVTNLNLGVWALSQLAASPPEAREEVLRRAEAGEAVPRPEVKRITQEAKAKLQDQRRAPSQPPTRRKLAKPEPVAEDNPWSGWGAAAPLGAALHEIGELVTGGDANTLYGTLDSAVRSMDEGRRVKVQAALEVLGRLDEELRKNPPQNETRPHA